MMTLKLLGGLILSAALYVAVAMEATGGGRTLLPHAPAVLLVLSVWLLPTTPAVVMAALTGLMCDAIGTGILGPGLISAVVATFVGGELKRRWKLTTVLSTLLLADVIGIAFLAGQRQIMASMKSAVIPPSDLQLLAGRGVSSALAALLILGGILLVRRITHGLLSILLAR